MEEKIRVLFMEPDKETKEIWIAPTHKVLSELLGGEIKMENPLNDGTVIISRVGAEKEDILPNRILRNNREQVVKEFHGKLIVAGIFAKAGELDSLTDGEIKLCDKRLEMFLARRMKRRAAHD